MCMLSSRPVDGVHGICLCSLIAAFHLELCTTFPVLYRFQLLSYFLHFSKWRIIVSEKFKPLPCFPRMAHSLWSRIMAHCFSPTGWIRSARWVYLRTITLYVFSAFHGCMASPLIARLAVISSAPSRCLLVDLFYYSIVCKVLYGSDELFITFINW